MKSETGSGRATGAILFVRGMDDMASAVRAVNDILALRGSTDPRGEVLGIFLSAQVDSNLGVQASCGGRSANDCVSLCEAVSVSGIWSLCWFEVGHLDAHASVDFRRRYLLDALTTFAAKRLHLFILALTSTESHQEIPALLDDLATAHPAIQFGKDCFVLNPTRGLVRVSKKHEVQYHPASLGPMSLT